jgi:hypothetical protein
MRGRDLHHRHRLVQVIRMKKMFVPSTAPQSHEQSPLSFGPQPSPGCLPAKGTSSELEGTSPEPEPSEFAVWAPQAVTHTRTNIDKATAKRRERDRRMSKRFM